MTTIKISVKSKTDADLLIRMLKNVSFVEFIEETSEAPAVNRQFDNIQSVLKELKGVKVFSEIEDPALWQRKIREEWE